MGDRQEFAFVGVDPIILTKDNKVVLALRGNDAAVDAGKWHIPGGLVKHGERITATLKRIAKEKTGLDIELLYPGDLTKSFIGMYDDPSRDSRFHDIALSFLCEITGGQTNAGLKIAEVKAFDFDAAEKLDMALDHKTILNDALKRLNRKLPFSKRRLSV